jgi:hypothetical protein
MERITVKNLNGVMHLMALTLGIPEGPLWTPRPDGKGSQSRIGALVLQQGSRYYGNAWAISQIMNEGGGENTLLRAHSARELFDAAHAWIAGYDAAKRGTGVQS